MTYQTLQEILNNTGLMVSGIIRPDQSEKLPTDCAVLLLLSPNATFWDVFTQSAEYQDGTPDPLDRWSKRVINDIAEHADAQPQFPFGGPPYAPFQHWAMVSGASWQSPVSLLVHQSRGLMISFRGALSFATDMDDAQLPATDRPCDTCDAPCLTACPAQALTRDGYDVAACRAYLDNTPGNLCLKDGCRVRRACPIGHDIVPSKQAAFHMAAFKN